MQAVDGLEDGFEVAVQLMRAALDGRRAEESAIPLPSMTEQRRDDSPRQLGLLLILALQLISNGIEKLTVPFARVSERSARDVGERRRARASALVSLLRRLLQRGNKSMTHRSRRLPSLLRIGAGLVVFAPTRVGRGSAPRRRKEKEARDKTHPDQATTSASLLFVFLEFFSASSEVMTFLAVKASEENIPPRSFEV